MRFAKLQATGNDFILVDGRGVLRDWAKLAHSMCRRHLGVGADGMLLLSSSSVADFQMRVFNVDGSEAETSGNGLRCFVKYVVDTALAPQEKKELEVETLAGIRRARPYLVDGRVRSVEAAMGLPRFEAEEIPVSVGQQLDPTLRFNYPLDIEGKEMSFSVISMGNPHAICFVAETVEEFPLSRVGPLVEHHPIFPRGSNFEVANILSRRQIAARVWERGVGETLSCGSGACAVAVAAQVQDYVEPQVDIMLPGGRLTVCWDREGEGEVLLSGAVDFVFRGEWLEEG